MKQTSWSVPFLQLQIPYGPAYGKHIWNIKLCERQRIDIITKMVTIYMHHPLCWPLTLTFKTFGKKNSQQPFSEPTRQDEPFGI